LTSPSEIKEEQLYFDAAWEARERMRSSMQSVSSAAGGSNKTVAAVRRAGEEHASRLSSAEEPVAFGRFDRDGERFYIGYHLISSDDRDALVINWKTKAAEPFYKATVQTPLGLERKRTYSMSANTIEDFSDLLFAQLAEDVAELTSAEQWGIDDALLRDLNAKRSGEMRDIVQTIHASQFDLVQSPMRQLLIVQGGPGTGKTAIALHRISWLLFNHQSELEPSTCLVIGPNPTFTRYINAVLPGLGDRDVAYRDLRGLGPVKGHQRPETDAVARIKGDARMSDLLRHGLWQRVGFPERGEHLTVGSDSSSPAFSKDEINAEVDRYKERNYNAGRAGLRQFLQVESQRRSRRGAAPPLALIENALERVWPQVTPASFLREFLASRDRLMLAAEQVMPEFTVSEVRSLQRAQAERLSSEQWSDADVALLDELDELINGQGATYVHIVVDEAQDLSPMQLRSVRRRSRTGSMTVVGDIAQSSGAWARDDWQEIARTLTSEDPCVTHELSLGYRVPRQVFEFAAQLLPVAAPSVTPPRVVRDGPADPELIEVATTALAAEAVAAASRHAGNGRFVGLICPDRLRERVIAQFDERGISWADIRNGELGKSINLANAAEAKGLEFEAVVVADPEEIAYGSPRGHRLLYVALTRTTQYLTVIHDGTPMPSSATRDEDVDDDDLPMPATILSVDEPPTSAQEVVSSEVLSEVGLEESAVATAPSGVAPIDPVEPFAMGDGGRESAPKSHRPVERAKIDRVTRIVAAEMAADVRGTLVPAKFPDFLEALRRELGIGETAE